MIINGNSLEELKKFPDNYFHSVVTDPPYGLSFMGKKWDYNVPSVELWTEVFRVLKEGGYLLSFAGTRTQHRMAVNIEDAGFEIRDMIAWVYGSGFPKSHNIGKAVDKLQGNEREIIGTKGLHRYNTDRPPLDNMKGLRKDFDKANELTKGNSEWEGWGTALKPALEPITMARKPFKGTVANNVLKNGVGGINIDGCRVGGEKLKPQQSGKTSKAFNLTNKQEEAGTGKLGNNKINEQNKGRFPANFIHDGSDEVKDVFPKKGRSTKASNGGKKQYGGAIFGSTKGIYEHNIVYKDEGNASRFFYCAKASKQDRNEGLEDFEDKKCGKNQSSLDGGKILTGAGNERSNIKKNHHPTVKPTDLMRYLVRLVTPKNGIVLDCFMGSGSTGKACLLEGFNFVGIDLDKDYCEIAKASL